MALIYRAHFAFSKNPIINSKGLNTSAIYGFTNTLLEVIKKEKPSHLGIAFDTKAPTFRVEMFKEYKANRQRQPEDIQVAIPYIKKLIQYFNIPILEKDGFEADDIIGTAVSSLSNNKDTEIYMMTPDKDFAQLVSSNVFLYKPAFMGRGVDILGEKEVINKFKIKRVDQVIDFLGLQGDSVDHDFVWAADPDYKHDKIQVPDGPLLSFYYQNNSVSMIENWERLQRETVKAFKYFNKTFGKYPYPVYSIIQAGDGGMEYPMATLITGERKFSSLLSVTIHEILHSWYQMVLATNESYYAWMDEGFTSFASNKTQNELFNNIYRLDSLNPLKKSYDRYYKFLKKNIEEPLTTHSDYFSTNEAYGVGSYSKGSIFLSQLGYIIGNENLYIGLRKYYNTWKFKHPDKYDFIRIMEKLSNLELDWYLDYWIGTTHKIDYGVSISNEKNNSVQVDLNKIGKIPMPLEVTIKYFDNTQDLYYIPLSIMRGTKKFDSKVKVNILSDWSWVNPTYSFKVEANKKEIYSIEIDSSQRMADVDRSNNYLLIE